MKTSTRLGGFALAAALVFGGAYGVGQAAGPIGTLTDTGHRGGHPDDTATPATGSGELPAAGLLISQDGYRLQLTSDDAIAGQPEEFAFRILGPDGAPVTEFSPTHDKRMHLILARRDLSGFQHVHPAMDTDGTWRIPVTFAAAGDHRAFADFAPTGSQDAITLGADVAVAGNYTPVALPEPAATATIDGYTVELAGDLVPGRTSKLTLTVSRDGRPVTDLQPYLAAYGHLVALRDGDLAYLHVHPDGAPGDGRTEPGPQITFFAEVPSAGDYRLYLDFQHEGTVRTAEFTAVAQQQGPASPLMPAGGGLPAPAEEPEHGGH